MNPQQINIQATSDDLKGKYSNGMQVTQTPNEFILDFLVLNPIQNLGAVAARLFVSPGHLKSIISVLNKSLKDFETKFGQVKAVDEPRGEMGFQIK